jgi:putative transposase
MTTINFARNELLDINGEHFRIMNRTEGGLLNLEHVKDGFMTAKSDDELAKLWRRGELIRVPDNGKGTMKESERSMLLADFSALPQRVQAAATRRLAYVTGVREENPRFCTPAYYNPIIARVAEAIGDPNPPTARRVADWVKLHARNGNPGQNNARWVAPRYHLRGNRSERFAPEVVSLVWDIIDREYLKRQPMTAKDMWLKIVGDVGEMRVEGIDPVYRTPDGKKLLYPSLVTLRRWLNSIDRETVLRCQRGKVEADRKYKPVLKGPQGEGPLHEVEIDHHKLDIIILDDTRLVPLGRPWLTVGLCRYTREIVGHNIGFQAPSAYTAGLCIRHMCMPKDGDTEEFPELRESSPVFGVPHAVIVDNGVEFDSASFMKACYGLGINVVRAPVRSPQYKGKVERIFGTITRDFVQKIPGTTFSNAMARGDYKSEELAVCTLRDFRLAFHKWITEVYRKSPHRALGMSPAEKWAEATRSYDVRMAADISQLDVLLTMTAKRRLTRRGIEFRGLIYNSQHPEFRALITRPDNGTRQVDLRVNPDDLSSIVLEDWRDGSTHIVPSIDPEYTTGLNLALHEILQDKVKEQLQAHQRVTIPQLVQARREFEILIKNLKRQKKLALKFWKAASNDVADKGQQRFTFPRGAEEYVHAPAVVPAGANTQVEPPQPNNDDTPVDAVKVLGLVI